jgi:hypothetical protein
MVFAALFSRARRTSIGSRHRKYLWAQNRLMHRFHLPNVTDHGDRGVDLPFGTDGAEVSRASDCSSKPLTRQVSEVYRDFVCNDSFRWLSSGATLLLTATGFCEPLWLAQLASSLSGGVPSWRLVLRFPTDRCVPPPHLPNAKAFPSHRSPSRCSTTCSWRVDQLIHTRSGCVPCYCDVLFDGERSRYAPPAKIDLPRPPQPDSNSNTWTSSHEQIL